jgi:nuclear transport factor 2 (NTF2) superfamily protein
LASLHRLSAAIPERRIDVVDFEGRWPFSAIDSGTNVEDHFAAVGAKMWKYRASYVDWAKELDYRLIKELWAFTENRIAVRYANEWHDDSGNRFRSYGKENWEFGEDGLMSNRYACINEMPVKESERKFHWPLGRRPDDHPSLSDLGL